MYSAASPFNTNSMLSIADAPPYATKYYDPTKVTPNVFKHVVMHDHGIDVNKKNSLLTMLDSPEWVDHLVVGAAGAALTKATASYLGMSKPAQTLMSLAGFGIGNIMYNQFKENKFTTYDPDTGRSRIRM